MEIDEPSLAEIRRGAGSQPCQAAVLPPGCATCLDEQPHRHGQIPTTALFCGPCRVRYLLAVIAELQRRIYGSPIPGGIF